MPAVQDPKLGQVPSEDPEKEGGGPVPVTELAEISPEQAGQEEDVVEHKQTVSRGSLVTFGLAIIVHTVVEGLAIGVFDEVESVIVLAANVVIHKIPVAFAVGTSFAV